MSDPRDHVDEYFRDEITIDDDDDGGLVPGIGDAGQYSSDQDRSGQYSAVTADGETRDSAWGSDKRWTLFMNPRVDGLCFNPWQFLKVDIFGRSNVCCSYFGRLPKFVWLPANEFHGEDGLWNHPFMQHMRAKTGTDEEVPYCGFCQGRYRPDLPGRSARRLAVTESQKLLQDKIDEVNKFDYSGTIDELPEDLSEWSFPLQRKHGYDWAPFKTFKQYYRRDVRMSGFQDLGDVAVLGSSAAAYVPFLVEPNNRVHIVDWQKNQLLNVQELMGELAMVADSTVLHIDGVLKLPFEDGSLDGVWLDGRRWLERFRRDELFDELYRVLRDDGRLRVVNAPGCGRVTLTALDVDDHEHRRHLLSVLDQDGRSRGSDAFFNIDTMYRDLKEEGFALDKERPPQIKPVGNAWRELPGVGRNVRKLAAQLANPDFLAELQANRDRLDGLEEYVSFTAMRGQKERARIPVTIANFSLNGEM